MHSLFKNPVFISFLKVIACVLLIALSHSAFLWQNILPAGYEAVSLLWLYFGMPLCLIMILTGGKPAAAWTGFWPFMGKLAVSLIGVFLLLLLLVGFLIVLSFDKTPDPSGLWIGSCFYYLLLLLIWQPQVFGKSLKWVRYAVISLYVLIALFILL